MDLFRKIFEAMHQAKQKPATPKPAPVVVGRLTDEEVLAFRQLDVLLQEHTDLTQQVLVKTMEHRFRKEAFYTALRQRLGITFASMTNVTEDYLVQVPRDEAAKHGVISG